MAAAFTLPAILNDRYLLEMFPELDQAFEDGYIPLPMEPRMFEQLCDYAWVAASEPGSNEYIRLAAFILVVKAKLGCSIDDIAYDQLASWMDRAAQVNDMFDDYYGTCMSRLHDLIKRNVVPAPVVEDNSSVVLMWNDFIHQESLRFQSRSILTDAHFLEITQLESSTTRGTLWPYIVRCHNHPAHSRPCANPRRRWRPGWFSRNECAEFPFYPRDIHSAVQEATMPTPPQRSTGETGLSFEQWAMASEPAPPIYAADISPEARAKALRQWRVESGLPPLEYDAEEAQFHRSAAHRHAGKAEPEPEIAAPSPSESSKVGFLRSLMGRLTWRKSQPVYVTDSRASSVSSVATTASAVSRPASPSKGRRRHEFDGWCPEVVVDIALERQQRDRIIALAETVLSTPVPATAGQPRPRVSSQSTSPPTETAAPATPLRLSRHLDDLTRPNVSARPAVRNYAWASPQASGGTSVSPKRRSTPSRTTRRARPQWLAAPRDEDTEAATEDKPEQPDAADTAEQLKGARPTYAEAAVQTDALHGMGTITDGNGIERVMSVSPSPTAVDPTSPVGPVVKLQPATPTPITVQSTAFPPVVVNINLVAPVEVKSVTVTPPPAEAASSAAVTCSNIVAPVPIVPIPKIIVPESPTITAFLDEYSYDLDNLPEFLIATIPEREETAVVELTDEELAELDPLPDEITFTIGDNGVVETMDDEELAEFDDLPDEITFTIGHNGVVEIIDNGAPPSAGVERGVAGSNEITAAPVHMSGAEANSIDEAPPSEGVERQMAGPDEITAVSVELPNVTDDDSDDAAPPLEGVERRTAGPIETTVVPVIVVSDVDRQSPLPFSPPRRFDRTGKRRSLSPPEEEYSDDAGDDEDMQLQWALRESVLAARVGSTRAVKLDDEVVYGTTPTRPSSAEPTPLSPVSESTATAAVPSSPPTAPFPTTASTAPPPEPCSQTQADHPVDELGLPLDIGGYLDNLERTDPALMAAFFGPKAGSMGMNSAIGGIAVMEHSEVDPDLTARPMTEAAVERAVPEPTDVKTKETATTEETAIRIFAPLPRAARGSVRRSRPHMPASAIFSDTAAPGAELTALEVSVAEGHVEPQSPVDPVDVPTANEASPVDDAKVENDDDELAMVDDALAVMAIASTSDVPNDDSDDSDGDSSVWAAANDVDRSSATLGDSSSLVKERIEQFESISSKSSGSSTTSSQNSSVSSRAGSRRSAMSIFAGDEVQRSINDEPRADDMEDKRDEARVAELLGAVVPMEEAKAEETDAEAMIMGETKMERKGAAELEPKVATEEPQPELVTRPNEPRPSLLSRLGTPQFSFKGVVGAEDGAYCKEKVDRSRAVPMIQDEEGNWWPLKNLGLTQMGKKGVEIMRTMPLPREPPPRMMPISPASQSGEDTSFESVNSAQSNNAAQASEAEGDESFTSDKFDPCLPQKAPMWLPEGLRKERWEYEYLKDEYVMGAKQWEAQQKRMRKRGAGRPAKEYSATARDPGPGALLAELERLGKDEASARSGAGLDGEYGTLLASLRSARAAEGPTHTEESQPSNGLYPQRRPGGTVAKPEPRRISWSSGDLDYNSDEEDAYESMFGNCNAAAESVPPKVDEPTLNAPVKEEAPQVQVKPEFEVAPPAKEAAPPAQQPEPVPVAAEPKTGNSRRRRGKNKGRGRTRG